LEPIEADMTPMIDMTFQLIAFFMVVTNFSAADQNKEINLPTSELAKPPDAPFEYSITVQVTRPEGANPSMVIFDGRKMMVPQIRTLLYREKKFLELREQKVSVATIIIRADGNAQTGTVQQIIQICQEVGFEKFALRAEQGAVSTKKDET
jgi:biopolymer transport protein ExbD